MKLLKRRPEIKELLDCIYFKSDYKKDILKYLDNMKESDIYNIKNDIYSGAYKNDEYYITILKNLLETSYFNKKFYNFKKHFSYDLYFKNFFNNLLQSKSDVIKNFTYFFKNSIIQKNKEAVNHFNELINEGRINKFFVEKIEDRFEFFNNLKTLNVLDNTSLKKYSNLIQETIKKSDVKQTKRNKSDKEIKFDDYFDDMINNMEMGITDILQSSKRLTGNLSIDDISKRINNLKIRYDSELTEDIEIVSNIITLLDSLQVSLNDFIEDRNRSDEYGEPYSIESLRGRDYKKTILNKMKKRLYKKELYDLNARQHQFRSKSDSVFVLTDLIETLKQIDKIFYKFSEEIPKLYELFIQFLIIHEYEFFMRLKTERNEFSFEELYDILKNEKENFSKTLLRFLREVMGYGARPESMDILDFSHISKISEDFRKQIEDSKTVRYTTMFQKQIKHLYRNILPELSSLLNREFLINSYSRRDLKNNNLLYKKYMNQIKDFNEYVASSKSFFEKMENGLKNTDLNTKKISFQDKYA